MNSIHGNRELTDRRASVEQQIAFYRHQLALARAGHSTRRSAEFLERQLLYFQSEAR